MNLVGMLYFMIILLANSIGALSGMGGGVLIKPIFDFVGVHPLSAISFYSAVAVFTMSIVSTYKQMKNGVHIQWANVIWVSLGSVFGGILGNITFEKLLQTLAVEQVQLLQIILTVTTLLFSYFYSRYHFVNFEFKHQSIYFGCGLVLGFLASLLGIGGGPINVAALMMLFHLPIKDATVYSICTIFFSQLAKIVTIGIGTGFSNFELDILLFIIPAAILGGYFGARLSKLLSPEKVTRVFQLVILLVLFINIYNGVKLF